MEQKEGRGHVRGRAGGGESGSNRKGSATSAGLMAVLTSLAAVQPQRFIKEGIHAFGSQFQVSPTNAGGNSCVYTLLRL